MPTPLGYSNSKPFLGVGLGGVTGLVGQVLSVFGAGTDVFLALVFAARSTVGNIAADVLGGLVSFLCIPLDLAEAAFEARRGALDRLRGSVGELLNCRGLGGGRSLDGVAKYIALGDLVQLSEGSDLLDELGQGGIAIGFELTEVRFDDVVVHETVVANLLLHRETVAALHLAGKDHAGLENRRSLELLGPDLLRGGHEPTRDSQYQYPAHQNVFAAAPAHGPANSMKLPLGSCTRVLNTCSGSSGRDSPVPDSHLTWGLNITPIPISNGQATRPMTMSLTCLIFSSTDHRLSLSALRLQLPGPAALDLQSECPGQYRAHDDQQATIAAYGATVLEAFEEVETSKGSEDLFAQRVNLHLALGGSFEENILN